MTLALLSAALALPAGAMPSAPARVLRAPSGTRAPAAAFGRAAARASAAPRTALLSPVLRPLPALAARLPAPAPAARGGGRPREAALGALARAAAGLKAAAASRADAPARLRAASGESFDGLAGRLGAPGATAGAFAAEDGRPRRPAPYPFRVPSAEELFLRGAFSVRRAPWKLLDEDRYGKELDLSERRPAVELAGTVFEARYGRPGTRLYANFFHEGRFFIARVPEGGMEAAFFQLSYFPPKIGPRYIAAHSLLRFKTKGDAPIELAAEMPDAAALARLEALPPGERAAALPEELSGPRRKIRNAAISAEAQWTKDDPHKKYDLMRGRHGAFIQIVRFMSIEERLHEFFRSGNPVAQIELPEADPGRLLAEGLRLSEQDGLSKLYDTFWYNCTTLAFDIVERAMGRRDRRLGHIRRFMQRRVPTRSPAKLAQFGGVSVTPAHQDESLQAELLTAYLAARRLGRGLCREGMSDEACANLAEAEAFLRRRGLIL